MAKRRKGRDVNGAMPDDVEPTAWRRQHGAVERSADQMLDARGLIGSPFLTRDTLDQMLRQEAINAAQWSAGREFGEHFQHARLNPLHCPDLGRIPGQAGQGMADSIVYARESVARAIRQLGGHGSPAGECAWWVLGAGMTLREWAHREGWQGRPLRPQTASGILIGTLGVLAVVYGHEPAKAS